MQQIEIRPFEETDQPIVVTLWNAVFGYPQPRNDPARVIQRKLVFERDLFYVAVLEGRIVGTVMGGYDGHRGWIYSLAVDPEVRRRGIGAALMRHVEQALKQRGAPKINLQLLATNAATVEFYKKVGYTVEERISMGKLIGDSP